MASLFLSLNIPFVGNPDGLTRGWGEYPIAKDKTQEDNYNFIKFRNNFRCCHDIKGFSPKQRPEDYFLPRPLTRDFRNDIISEQNTKRRIPPPISFDVLPQNDFERCTTNGEFVLSKNTREALEKTHRNLSETCYSKSMVDHSPIINTTSTNPNPQHHRNNVICKMLVRNNQCGSETLPLFHANKMSPHSPDICTSPSPESCRVPHSEPLPDLCNKKKTASVLPQATQSCEKQRRRVRFDLPRRMNKTPTCPEYARPRPNSGTKRTISAPQPITPQNWQTMDFETRRAASLKPNTAIESERFISTREKLFHHMNLIRKMGNEVTDQQTCVDGDKENSVVDDDESDDGNDDEKEMKPEEAYQADAGKSSGYKEICTPGSDESSRLEEKAQTLPKVYKDIKLIQRAGKFIPNRINILNPNYLCSKSTSCKRYHHLFKDLVPDLRDNYKYGKRVNFYGFNSSSFRG